MAEEVATNYSSTVDFTARLSKIYDFEYMAFWQPVSFTESSLNEEERNSDDLRKDVSLGMHCFPSAEFGPNRVLI
jgi:hypothetical protein